MTRFICRYIHELIKPCMWPGGRFWTCRVCQRSFEVERIPQLPGVPKGWGV